MLVCFYEGIEHMDLSFDQAVVLLLTKKNIYSFFFFAPVNIPFFVDLTLVFVTLSSVR